MPMQSSQSVYPSRLNFSCGIAIGKFIATHNWSGIIMVIRPVNVDIMSVSTVAVILNTVIIN